MRNLKATANDIHLVGSRQDYVIPGSDIKKYRTVINAALVGNYLITASDAHEPGQSHSQVVKVLREAKLYVPSDFISQLRLFERLGFSVKRGRGERVYGEDKKAYGVECIVVTGNP